MWSGLLKYPLLLTSFYYYHECRGLKAFVKYVPTDVVKMMLVGDMESNNVMNRKAVSILFMDIPAFTDIAEKIQPDQLMTLTTDYLQGMCDVIVHSHGTLDKVQLCL